MNKEIVELLKENKEWIEQFEDKESYIDLINNCTDPYWDLAKFAWDLAEAYTEEENVDDQ